VQDAAMFVAAWVYEENVANSDDNVFRLMVSNIQFSPYSAHRYLA